MSTEANRAVIERFIDGYNLGDLSVIDTFIANEIVDHGRPFLPPGRDAHRAFHETLEAAISDLHIQVDDLIAEGDKVVFRGVVTGRHTGELMGIPATNRTFSLSVIDINRIKDGKIVERWGVQDDLGMLRQLGILPAPENAST
jgi:predicted ester cyclase